MLGLDGWLLWSGFGLLGFGFGVGFWQRGFGRWKRLGVVGGRVLRGRRIGGQRPRFWSGLGLLGLRLLGFGFGVGCWQRLGVNGVGLFRIGLWKRLGTADASEWQPGHPGPGRAVREWGHGISAHRA